MKLRKKKGFTIVELVIVIAVIAILAAVLIPTFANLIARANESADIQAVKEMNTQLAIAEVDSTIATIGDAINALKKVNINMENYTPLRADTQFYWVKSLNRVIYVDLAAGNKVLFPKEYENLTQEKGDWYALNAKIAYEEYNTPAIEGNTKTYSISTAGQFAKFVNDYNNLSYDDKKNSKIVLTSDIDLAGAAAKFTFEGLDKGLGGHYVGSTPHEVYLTIDGTNSSDPNNNYTIYGFRDDSPVYTSDKGRYYGYGIFGSIGSLDNITIKNVTFSGMHVEDTQKDRSQTSGLIAGYLYGKLTLENVKFIDCTLSGWGQIGTIGGQCYGATVKMDNVSFENTIVKGSWAAAKILGSVNNRYLKLTVESNCDFDGIKVIDRDGRGTFSKSQFEYVEAKKKDGTASGQNSLSVMKGSDDNTYMLSDGALWPCVTNDWAWYYTGNGETRTQKNGALNYWYNFTDAEVTVNGQTTKYPFQGNCDSISESFTEGGMWDIFSEGKTTN